MAYGMGMAKISRVNSSVVGTVNDFAFLHDQRGNRRFDIVDVSKIDIEPLKADREQIFAEANELEKTYGYLVLPDAVKARRQGDAGRGARSRSSWPMTSRTRFNGKYGFVSRDDIYDYVL